MQTKQKFFFMVISAVLGVTILLIGMVVSPTTAQKDTFGEITCTGLTVLGQDGKKRVRLRDFLGGAVEVWDEDDNISATIYAAFPDVSVYGKDAKGNASLGIDKDGVGHISVVNRNGAYGVVLGIDEHGGVINVCNNEGRKQATMDVNKFGTGVVSTWDKHGDKSVDLK